MAFYIKYLTKTLLRLTTAARKTIIWAFRIKKRKATYPATVRKKKSIVYSKFLPPPYLCPIAPTWVFPTTNIHSPTPLHFTLSFPTILIFKDSSHRTNYQFYWTASYWLVMFTCYTTCLFSVFSTRIIHKKITKFDSFSP